MSTVFIDGTHPRLKIKKPKPDNDKSMHPRTTSNINLKRKSDSLSMSIPSLKLKIPRSQESVRSNVECEEGMAPLSSSTDSSGLKFVVSNGKILR